MHRAAESSHARGSLGEADGPQPSSQGPYAPDRPHASVKVGPTSESLGPVRGYGFAEYLPANEDKSFRISYLEPLRGRLYDVSRVVKPNRARTALRGAYTT